MIEDIVQERYENRYAKLREIGAKFGVTRQYVYKILKQTETPTLRLKKEKFTICQICDHRIEDSLAKVHLGKCHGEYYFHLVHCNSCYKKWHMKRAVVFLKARRGDRHIYCSRECYIKDRFYN
jgi:hypothetical protein